MTGTRTLTFSPPFARGVVVANLIDRAQEREQLDRELALQAQASRKTEGLANCEVCGAPISALRRGMGARLCVADQSWVEAEAKRRMARSAV
jgi:RNA polymerase-binding transcription factor DksA